MLTVGRTPMMNVLHDVMAIKPHLHQTKSYVLCNKDMDPNLVQLREREREGEGEGEMKTRDVKGGINGRS